jgi:hypothetical protein
MGIQQPDELLPDHARGSKNSYFDRAHPENLRRKTQNPSPSCAGRRVA